MSHHEFNMIERSAFAIYCEFIRGAVGTVMLLRDEDGRVITDSAGNGIRETPEQAATRRWNRAPEATRESFRREAVAALRAAA